MREKEGRLTCADDDDADKAGKSPTTLAGRTKEEDGRTPRPVIRPRRSKVVEAVRSMVCGGGGRNDEGSEGQASLEEGWGGWRLEAAEENTIGGRAGRNEASALACE